MQAPPPRFCRADIRSPEAHDVLRRLAYTYRTQRMDAAVLGHRLAWSKGFPWSGQLRAARRAG